MRVSPRMRARKPRIDRDAPMSRTKRDQKGVIKNSMPWPTDSVIERTSAFLPIPRKLPVDSSPKGRPP